MTAPSSAQAAPGRRRLGTALAVAILVLVGLLGYAVYDFVRGPATHSAATTAGGTGDITVQPGGGSSLVPLRTYARVGSTWRVKVVGVLWHVSASKIGIARKPGTWNVIVQFTARYAGRGRGSTQAVANGLRAVGAANVEYPVRAHALGNPRHGMRVKRGAAATDAVLFTVASGDAHSLKLFAHPAGRPAVGFALR